MKEYIQNIYVSPLEFLFNMALMGLWASFMWHTLIPRFSKKTTILILNCPRLYGQHKKPPYAGI